jgi:hypothetical protein
MGDQRLVIGGFGAGGGELGSRHHQRRLERVDVVGESVFRLRFHEENGITNPAAWLLENGGNHEKIA